MTRTPTTRSPRPAGPARRLRRFAPLALVAAAGLLGAERAVAQAPAPAPAPAAAPAPVAAPTPAPAAEPNPAQGVLPPAARVVEPSPLKPDWELVVLRHGTPKRIVVKHGNENLPTPYWYMTYTVINPGRREVPFNPEFEMLAANGKVRRGNLGIPEEVFDAIKKAEGNPYLTPHRQLRGKPIYPGAEQAKDGVAIFEEPVARMETFSIFIAGLSSDEQTLKRVNGKWEPLSKEQDRIADIKDADRLVVRKQYMVTYTVLGDAVKPGIDPIDKKYERFVMRP